ncbi:MAG: ABC transporter permease [Alphaproteobacteria bacterium]|nr:ABC transporter permease [Alphaproteobacteria bacterium]
MTSRVTAMIEPMNVWQLPVRRFSALLQRHIFLLRASWLRVINLIYWPMLNMIIWGFLNTYLTKQATGIQMAAGILLGAVMLWDVLARSQLNIQFPFMEELWSRNLPSIFVSPIRPLEYVAGLVFISMINTIIALTPCILLAYWFFDYWLPGLGLPLIAFIFNLAMTGWWGGCLLVAMMLRFGLAAEGLAWMASFIMAPLVAIYYPVSILPEWAQTISWLLPPTYIFEGMRSLVNLHITRIDYLVYSFLLNIFYLVISGFVFMHTFESKRRRDGLMHTSDE